MVLGYEYMCGGFSNTLGILEFLILVVKGPQDSRDPCDSQQVARVRDETKCDLDCEQCQQWHTSLDGKSLEELLQCPRSSDSCMELFLRSRVGDLWDLLLGEAS